MRGWGGPLPRGGGWGWPACLVNAHHRALPCGASGSCTSPLRPCRSSPVSNDPSSDGLGCRQTARGLHRHAPGLEAALLTHGSGHPPGGCRPKACRREPRGVSSRWTGKGSAGLRQRWRSRGPSGQPVPPGTPALWNALTCRSVRVSVASHGAPLAAPRPSRGWSDHGGCRWLPPIWRCHIAGDASHGQSRRPREAQDRCDVGSQSLPPWRPN
jgi:hypothetical protein